MKNANAIINILCFINAIFFKIGPVFLSKNKMMNYEPQAFKEQYSRIRASRLSSAMNNDI